jgi:hypothetical protein
MARCSPIPVRRNDRFFVGSGGHENVTTGEITTAERRRGKSLIVPLQNDLFEYPDQRCGDRLAATAFNESYDRDLPFTQISGPSAYDRCAFQPLRRPAPPSHFSGLTLLKSQRHVT